MGGEGWACVRADDRYRALSGEGAYELADLFHKREDPDRFEGQAQVT
jgi:hypothetical protein